MKHTHPDDKVRPSIKMLLGAIMIVLFALVVGHLTATPRAKTTAQPPKTDAVKTARIMEVAPANFAEVDLSQTTPTNNSPKTFQVSGTGIPVSLMPTREKSEQ